MATESAREARRRKILERGSDRLAFITGQTRSLPPPQDEGVSVAAEIKSDTPTEIELTDNGPSFNSNEATTLLRNRDIAHLTNDEASANLTSRSGAQPLVFNARIIFSSISATENLRLLCTISVGILTVLSWRGRVSVSDAGKSIFGFGPIYMVGLTNLAFLIGLVYTRMLKEKGGAGRGEKKSLKGGDLMDQVGTLLEVLIVVQKVAGALFADCCLCAVLVICGISF
ncbi:uncharacterized protein LOC144700563 [Wolffia australiana]